MQHLTHLKLNYTFLGPEIDERLVAALKRNGSLVHTEIFHNLRPSDVEKVVKCERRNGGVQNWLDTPPSPKRDYLVLC